MGGANARGVMCAEIVHDDDVADPQVCGDPSRDATEDDRARRQPVAQDRGDRGSGDISRSTTVDRR